MSNLTITCDRCKVQVDHRCNAELMPAIVQLFTWEPHVSVLDKKSPYYDPEDEGAPFMTETTLYNLLGKEDARTLLALVNQVIAAAGVDSMGVDEAVNKAMEGIEARKEENRVQHERSMLLRQIESKGKQGLWVPEAQWHLIDHLTKYPQRWQVSAPVSRKGVNNKRVAKVQEKKK